MRIQISSNVKENVLIHVFKYIELSNATFLNIFLFMLLLILINLIFNFSKFILQAKILKLISENIIINET